MKGGYLVARRTHATGHERVFATVSLPAAEHDAVIQTGSAPVRIQFSIATPLTSRPDGRTVQASGLGQAADKVRVLHGLARRPFA